MKLSRSLRCVESSSSKVKTVKTQMHAVLKCCVCFVLFSWYWKTLSFLKSTIFTVILRLHWELGHEFWTLRFAVLSTNRIIKWLEKSENGAKEFECRVGELLLTRQTVVFWDHPSKLSSKNGPPNLATLCWHPAQTRASVFGDGLRMTYLGPQTSTDANIGSCMFPWSPKASCRDSSSIIWNSKSSS